MATARTANNSELTFIAALVVAGCMLVAWLHTPATETALGGLIFGTMYGVLALAAAWFPLGPFPFATRALLIVALLSASAVGVALLFGLGLAILVFPAVMLFAQWVAAQIPFWCLVVFFHLQISHPSRFAQPASENANEFAIRHVVILTTLVGASLGIVWTFLPFSNVSEPDWGALLAIGFVAAVDALIVFPLTIAVLLERRAVLATVIASGLAVLVAAMEIPVIQRFPHALSDPGAHWSIHAVRLASIFGVLLILRSYGYRLARVDLAGTENLSPNAKVSLSPGR
jgi:hypothetical protein